MLAPTRKSHLLWFQAGMLAVSGALALNAFMTTVKVEPHSREVAPVAQARLGQTYVFAALNNVAGVLKQAVGLPKSLNLPPLPKAPAPVPQFPARLPVRAEALVKHLEARRLAAYRDAAGILTVGFGHTGDVAQGSTVTPHKAEQLLRQDLDAAQQAVRRHVTVRLNVNEFSALISLVFNIGEDAFARSSGLALLNHGERHAAAVAFLAFNKARVCGQIAMLSGLVRRRHIEQALFLRTPGDGDNAAKLVLAGETIALPQAAAVKAAAAPVRVAAIVPPAGWPKNLPLQDRHAPEQPPLPRPDAHGDVTPNRMWLVA